MSKKCCVFPNSFGVFGQHPQNVATGLKPKWEIFVPKKAKVLLVPLLQRRVVLPMQNKNTWHCKSLCCVA